MTLTQMMLTMTWMTRITAYFCGEIPTWITPIESVVQLKAQHRGERMMYAVKSGTRTPFEDFYWCKSATQALSNFKSRENITSSQLHKQLPFFSVFNRM